MRFAVSSYHSTLVGEHLHEASRLMSWSSAIVEFAELPLLPTDIDELAELGRSLGESLIARNLQLLGVPAKRHVAYGKGAVLGQDIPLETAAAILHPKMGAPIRLALGGGKSIIPSTYKRGKIGDALDVPLHGKDDEWNFGLLDSVTVSIEGAPRAREALIVVATSLGGRRDAIIGRDQLDR